ncbi:Hypothetical protein A7982_10125 [Minicystis rosea]|nr:Hypothetical protein A7982_10125 [Minicystis rosea]
MDGAPAPAGGPDASLRLSIHDTCRLEWEVTIPFEPARRVSYEVDVALAIPSPVFTPHVPWSQLQSYARLDHAVDAGPAGSSVEALRGEVVAVAGELSSLGRELADVGLRTAALASGAHLARALDASLIVARVARARLTSGLPGDLAAVTEERRRADDYLSLQLIAMLTGAARALDEARTLTTVPEEAFMAAEERIVRALAAENGHRRKQGFVCADPSSPSSLGDYMEHVSRLKKHFHATLFLDAEVRQRARPWLSTAFVFIVVTVTFLVQGAIDPRYHSAASRARVLAAALLMGLLFALRDRIRELGVSWWIGRRHRAYGQRFVSYRLPAHLPAIERIAVRAREAFDREEARDPDLSGDDGGKPYIALRFSHRGMLSPAPTLAAPGARRVKHVFRYDLSPLFTRLSDAVKPLAVVDPETRRLRVVDAPRIYRLPIRVRLRCGSLDRTTRATLVINKHGLLRLDTSAPDSLRAAA